MFVKILLCAAFVATATIATLGVAQASALRSDLAQTESFFVHRVDPVYPQSAKDQGIEGDVTVAVHCDRAGRAIGAEITKSSGHSILDGAALRAAIASTYVPAHSEMTYSVLYTFKSVTLQQHAGSMMVR